MANQGCIRASDIVGRFVGSTLRSADIRFLTSVKRPKKLQLLVIYSCNVVMKVYQKVVRCEFFIVISPN